MDVIASSSDEHCTSVNTEVLLMTAEVICALIAGISSIVAAAIGWRVKRSNDRAEAHSQLRRKESRCRCACWMRHCNFPL